MAPGYPTTMNTICTTRTVHHFPGFSTREKLEDSCLVSILYDKFCEDVQTPEHSVRVSEEEAEIQDLFHEREEMETKPWKKGTQSLSH